MRAKIGALMAAVAAAVSAAGAAVWARRRRGETDEERVTDSAHPAKAGGAGAGGVGATGAPATGVSSTAPPATASPDGDDLTAIKGLGAVSQGRLQEAGVTTFAQIAAWDDAEIEAVGHRIKISPERIRREDWVGQARAKAEG